MATKSSPPSNNYHFDTHKQLQFVAQAERRTSPGAANYYHRSVNKSLIPDLEHYYAQSVAPLLDKAGYPNVGSEQHHNVIKQVVSNWRSEPLDEKVKETDIQKSGGGDVEGDIPNIENPISVFPKPQRMFPEDARPAGGQYINTKTKEDMTGHKAAKASIGVHPGGKAYLNVSEDAIDETGSPGRGSAIAKANLFKQKAGWRWLQAPEGHEDTNTIVSVHHRQKHHFALNAHYPNGVDLARYPNEENEPRLRPTTKGNLTKGNQVGTISVRGKEHPVYDHVIVKADGGDVEGYIPHDDPRRERNFQRWFGKSTVVDKEMKPWVHYHITKGNFSRFIPGGLDPEVSGPAIWLTPHKKEQPAGHNVGGFNDQFEEGANVMPLYVKMEKPLFVDESDPEGKKELKQKFGSNSFAWPMTLHHKDIQKMKDAGYDGIYHIRNDDIAGHFNPETGEGLETIVFHPSQLKSAIGNDGSFRPHEEDITKADGGALTDDEGITAYHGSPHDFERFDTSKIGTGEGAQSFGHGLYFAQNEGIARGYRDQLSNQDLLTFRNPQTGKILYQGDDIPDHVLEAYKYLESGREAAGQFPHNTGYYALQQYEKTGKSDPDVVSAINELKDAKIRYEKNPGHMYEVHIKAHPDHFINWDAPLSEQHPDVWQKLVRGPSFIKDAVKNGILNNKTYGDIHGTIVVKHPRGQQGVSEHLSEMGIPGIKYLDAGSRTTTDKPTRNYVVFNHDHVAVRRKYAEGGRVGFADGGIIPPVEGGSMLAGTGYESDDSPISSSTSYGLGPSASTNDAKSSAAPNASWAGDLSGNMLGGPNIGPTSFAEGLSASMPGSDTGPYGDLSGVAEAFGQSTDTSDNAGDNSGEGGDGGDGGGDGGGGGGGDGEKRGGRIYPLRNHTDWEEAHDYEKTGGKLHYETPDHYLDQVKPLNMDHDDKHIIHHFEKQMKKGEKLDPVAIYPDGHPNGRHRAEAAKKLGIKKLPVVDWEKKKGGGPIVQRALMVISKKV